MLRPISSEVGGMDHDDADPTADDFLLLGATAAQVKVLACASADERKHIYRLMLEVLMSG